jgi:hypothetical protein
MTASFSAEVLAGGGGGHAVVVPREIAASLSEKRPRVLALVDGAEYRSRIAVYGGKAYLGLRKDLLRSLGKDTGDTVTIELTEEATQKPEAVVEPREPVELTDVLAAHPDGRATFDALPPSHRREYYRWIAEAAKPETRTQRAQKTLHRLHDQRGS